MPIRSEIGAVELEVLDERMNARRRSAVITTKEIAV